MHSPLLLGLLKTSFDIECKSIVCGDRTSSSSPVDITVPKAVPCETLDQTALSHSISGNPLELEEIVNLSFESKFVVDPSKKRMCCSKFLDFTNAEPIKKKPPGGYEEGVLYYVSADRQQLFGVFPMAKSSRRILRISTIRDPDLTASIDSTQRKHMTLFPTFRCGFEAQYQLADAVFRVEFDSTDTSVLSPPLSYVIGTLSTELNLYDCQCLPSVLEDILLLKVIFDAYENDTSVWGPSDESTVDLEQFRNSLPSVLKFSVEDKPTYALADPFAHTTLLPALATRQLDTTETMWNALKRVNSRQNLRRFVRVATAYLLEHRELLKVHRSNQTQLAMRLRSMSGFASGQLDVDEASSFPFGIENLLEIGLYKVMNDCLCLLECVIPDVTSTVVDQGHTWNLEHSWSQLHHLYKTSCYLASWSSNCSKEAFLPELRKLLSQPDPKGEWRTALWGSTFRCTHTFPVAVSDLVLPISCLGPSLWIMRLDADEPMRARVRIIYERVQGDGMDKYICHEMRLVDTYWPENS